MGLVRPNFPDICLKTDAKIVRDVVDYMEYTSGYQ